MTLCLEGCGNQAAITEGAAVPYPGSIMGIVVVMYCEHIEMQIVLILYRVSGLSYR